MATCPHWFLGYDILLETLYAIIGFIIALFSYKIFSETKIKNIKFFSIAFLLISLSYLVQAIFNTMFEIYFFKNFFILAAYSHAFLMISGLLLLIYSIKYYQNINDYWLVLLITIIALTMTNSLISAYYIISSVLLLIISVFYIKNFFKKKNNSSLIITIAFILMLVTRIHFLIAEKNPFFYASAHIIEFIAYLLIIINLYLINNQSNKIN